MRQKSLGKRLVGEQPAVLSLLISMRGMNRCSAYSSAAFLLFLCPFTSSSLALCLDLFFSLPGFASQRLAY